MAITAVSGMGGIGKTALAQQYVRTAKDQYPGGRWYFKVREQSLVSQLVSAATVFGQLPDNLPDDRARVKWCYDQWCHHFPGARLLLLDDVQTYSDVKDFLPVDQTSFRVLMTSRQRFGNPVDRLDLGVLPLDEALELFGQLVDNQERVRQQQTEAEALCEWVGRLPLGVELIARYLALHPNVTFAKLQERLERKRLDAKAMRELPEEIAYEYSIEAAFELSWQDLGPKAKTLMGVLSVFAAAPIPKEIIEGALPEWDEEDLEDSLDVDLVKRNLLQSDADGSYQLHQLIREFIQGKLKTELSEQSSALQKGVADSLVKFAKRIQQIVTVNAQQIVDGVAPHMALVARELSQVENSTDFTWPFVGLGRFYQGQSLWSEAEYWYQFCLKIAEERFGPNHLATARSMNNLGLLYKILGRYKDAESLLTQALGIIEAQLGLAAPETTQIVNNLGLLYKILGRYKDAESLLTQALGIIEAQLGLNPLKPTILSNLGSLYRTLGHYKDAEPLYIQSLEIREAQLGPNHPDTATSLNNLGLLYDSMERYKDAEPLYIRALEIREAQLGPNHPDTATSLNNLAALYDTIEHYEDAEPLYIRALEIREAQLGPNHPDTAVSLNNLAWLYKSIGRYKDAEPLYIRALEIREAQLGRE